MAKNITNTMVEGTSGKFGNSVVYRQRGGITFLSKLPTRNPEKRPTDKQIAQQFRFMEASAYAKEAIEDTVLKEAYQEKARGNQTAYNVAFKDYLTAPQLHEVVTENYTGQPGSVISMKITDVLQVTHVKVLLEKTDGTLIEEGDAVINSKLKIEWNYTATVVNDAVSETIIKVQMTSTPGNIYLVSRRLIPDEI